MPEDNLVNLKHLNSVVATCTAIAKYHHRVIAHKDTPLFVAGDHSAVIGSISASSINYDNLGLIWIDAHPDINTPETTITGNIHGIPVSALLGMGETPLTKILSSQPKLQPDNIVMIGLRDIDPPEAEILEDLNIKYYTYDEVLEIGLEKCISESAEYLSHLDAVHLSFDVDSMDPLLMPGVSVPVASGFNQTDVYMMLNTFLTELPIMALDIVEFNMVHDVDRITSDFVSDLIQRILDGTLSECCPAVLSV